MDIKEEQTQIKTKRALKPSERLYFVAGALVDQLPHTAEILTDIALDVADLERKADQ